MRWVEAYNGHDPDIYIEAVNIVEDAAWAVVELRFRGTMKGAFAGHAPNNESFNMHGCEIFQIVNGKILIQHSFWDKATMLNQLKISTGM
ncbi:ester cyclase [Marispirochaeta aestuarii]|uniref:ester cyclase n=1 Tax=Marispirochaeta aestuarii TaxID=1963862 RepID=UPI0038B4138E